MADRRRTTPTPWRYEQTNGSPTTGMHMIAGGLPGYVAEVRDCGSGDVKANAALIVRAVNTLDEVVDVLLKIDDTLCVNGHLNRNTPLHDRIRSLLIDIMDGPHD